MEQPNPDVARSPVRGDGGLFSTAQDYGAFLRMFLNRGLADPLVFSPNRPFVT